MKRADARAMIPIFGGVKTRVLASNGALQRLSGEQSKYSVPPEHDWIRMFGWSSMKTSHGSVDDESHIQHWFKD